MEKRKAKFGVRGTAELLRADSLKRQSQSPQSEGYLPRDSRARCFLLLIAMLTVISQLCAAHFSGFGALGLRLSFQFGTIGQKIACSVIASHCAPRIRPGLSAPLDGDPVEPVYLLCQSSLCRGLATSLDNTFVICGILLTALLICRLPEIFSKLKARLGESR